MKKRVETEKDLVKRCGLRTDQHGVAGIGRESGRFSRRGRVVKGALRVLRVLLLLSAAGFAVWLVCISFRAFALGLGGVGPAVVVCLLAFPLVVWVISCLYSLLSFVGALFRELFS